MFDKHIIIVDNEGRNRYNENRQKELFCIIVFLCNLATFKND